MWEPGRQWEIQGVWEPGGLEKTLHAGDPQRSPEPQPEAHLRYYVVSSQYSKFQVGKLTERVREEIPQSKAILIVLAGI